MPKHRTPLEAAAGQLVLAIQKEWNAEIGEPTAARSEEVMDLSQTLLQAATTGSLANALASKSVSTFLGEQWVREHPAVLPYVEALETLGRVNDL